MRLLTISTAQPVQSIGHVSEHSEQPAHWRETQAHLEAQSELWPAHQPLQVNDAVEHSEQPAQASVSHLVTQSDVMSSEHQLIQRCSIWFCDDE